MSGANQIVSICNGIARHLDLDAKNAKMSPVGKAILNNSKVIGVSGEQYRQVHVLIVDDDKRICDLVSEYLQEEGFSVAAVHDGIAMRSALRRVSPEVVLLDVRLPGEDGLTLASELRRTGQCRIIILSEKDAVMDRVAGLEVGADDYVSKPFHLRELLARIRSVLRRETTTEGPAKFHFGRWCLDSGTRSLTDKTGTGAELSTSEFDLLRIFLENPQEALSRDRLLGLTNRHRAEPFDRSIDVRVGRLRRRIERDPRKPELIKTVRGIGYMFAAEVKRD